jgi:hypothetical protein
VSFPGTIYAPPGVYTRTLFESPVQGVLAGLRIPVFIGTGSEILVQDDLEVVRGSSSTVDQRIIQENLANRAVVSVSQSGAVTLGAFNGSLRRAQVRHYPIVNGNGTGTVATKASSVSITVNGEPVVVTYIDGANGIVELAYGPEATDDVRITYFFKRTDTLITDNLSAQVSSDAATVYGLGSETFEISTGDNDTLALTVDGATVTVTLPDSGATPWTAAQVAAFINAQAGTSTLIASTYTNNYGGTSVKLVADRDIVIGNGNANAILGFVAGTDTARTRTFYTYNGPIVDGSNGGVTTTDPADVTVKVNGVQVLPVSVDGTNRAVTLGFAPAAGATVTIQYYFNTWQDTFDYLAHVDVLEITNCGIAPGRSDYTDGVDFALKDDKIVWGTAVLVNSGTHTTGSEYFNGSQVTATLVDTRTYLEECAPSVDTSVSPAVESRTKFVLPLTPTTGNGRGSPLGSSLFQTVANDRIDLPTDRPDLVFAYWGYGAQDALDRGRVTVLKVDSATNTVTLKDPVPAGATVYATFYYNTLQDQVYSLVVTTAGQSGTGAYTVQNEAGTYLLTPTFGLKSSGLATVTVNFPSGSERKPDSRFETPFDTGYYVAPVEEDVTVTFAATDSTPGVYTFPFAGDYVTVDAASDKLRLLVDGASLANGAAGIDLTTPCPDAAAPRLGFTAAMIGSEIVYFASSGGTTYDIDTTNDTLNFTVDGVVLTATAATGAGSTLADYVSAINTAATSVAARLTAAGRFLGAFTVTAGEYDRLVFHYTGDVAGASGSLTATLVPSTYANAAALASQINTQFAALIGGLGGGFAGLAVAVSADASGRMVFELTKAAGDNAGYLEFVTGGTAARDFAIVAGIDTGTVGASQTKVLDGPIARRYSIAGDNTGTLAHDRIIVRNRVLPGNGTLHPLALGTGIGVTFLGGNGSANVGLTPNVTIPAAQRASVLPASMAGYVGWASGQYTAGVVANANGQPVVTFYAAGGTTAQNNVFKFTMDGVPVTVVFTDDAGAAIASGGSADVPLGPGSGGNSIIGQVRAAITAAGLGSASSRCIQEGASFRLVSLLSTAASAIVIGDGNANDALGFAAGDTASRVLPSAQALASALMGHIDATVAPSILSWDSPAATYFAAEALAYVTTDAGGAKYLTLQSQANAGLGTTSSIALRAASANDALRQGSGLGGVAGDGAVGEAGIAGFYVTSTDPNGSGSANTSVFNGGTGQDGVCGQTYRDLVTGLTFTVLPRTGGSLYPATEYFTFKVRQAAITDSNLPTNAIPGVELIVTNTINVVSGDSATVETMARGGEEPAVGDLYYVSYQYRKQDYQTALYTKFSAIEATYGPLSTDNPVTLAAYLAILNGAVLVGIKQVQKDEDNGTRASTAAYRNAIDDLEGALPGGTLPDILVPLKGDALDLFQYLSRHCDIQSDIRHRAERTALCGFGSGTNPSTAGNWASAIGRTRFRLVYPDVMIVPIPQPGGAPDEQTVVDGTYLAAMLAGSVVSPNTDVATPWTGKRLVGATRLARTLDAVEQNQVAVRGVTVIEDRNPILRVRQGLTTDMSTLLTKLPTIIQIVDETQRQSRTTLERYIGTKFLPGILSQIEGQLTATLRGLVDAQILAAYTGVTARVSADDATTAEVEAYVQPVFPLLYIIVTFNLRSSLSAR